MLDHWLTTAGIRPAQKSGPRVAITAGSPAAAALAAEEGYDLLALRGTNELEELIGRYREKSSGDGRVGVLRLVAVTPDGAVGREIYDATRWTLERRNRLVGLPPPDERQVAEYLAERAIIGDLRSVSERIAALAATGVDGLICWCRWGTMGDHTAHATMEQIAALRRPPS